MKTKNVYMVTYGSYSDYRVIGICSTKEIAEELKKLRGADRIERLTIDEMPERQIGLYWFSVDMDKSGNVPINGVQIKDCQYQTEEEWRPYGDDNLIEFSMWAKDENHAIKIATERRIRLIESDNWNTSWDEWKKSRA